LPRYFVENRGQWPDPVKYHLRSARMDVFFTPQAIVFYPFPGKNKAKKTGSLPESFKLTFPGANKHVSIEGKDRSRAKFNFFPGRMQKKKTGAGAYHKILYRELYPHIDMMVYCQKGQLKTEFRVKAGGDPGNIVLGYEGVKGITVNTRGQLEITTAAGIIKEDVPFGFQSIDHRRVQVAAAYVIHENNRVKFKLGEYKRDRRLIIDPLIFSTYLGSQGGENIQDLMLDHQGNIFLTGTTDYPDFLQGEEDVNSRFRRGQEVFLVKLNPAADEILFATFLGGTGYYDIGDGIDFDQKGNIYVLGQTQSPDFPITPGAYDATFGGFTDVFLIMLDPSGSQLLYGTYLGGKNKDYSTGIKVIAEGTAVITGRTHSSDFPVTAGAFDESFNSADWQGYSDGYVAAFDFNSGSLVYSTLVGGSGSDLLNGSALDQERNVYITGVTTSQDFPVTPGAYKTVKGSPQSVFVTKMNPTGSELVYSTFLGGDEEREVFTLQNGHGITVDQQGYAYVTGATECLDFPTTPGAFDRVHSGGRDTFVTKLNPTGSQLVFSTLLGGNPDIRIGDWGSDIQVDAAGNVYVTGMTDSPALPTTGDAISSQLLGQDDAYVTIFNPTGTVVLYSTYLGGAEVDESEAGGIWGGGILEDHGFRIFVDNGGNIYVAGGTYTYDFPITAGAVDPLYGGKGDIFLCKISAPINLNRGKEDGSIYPTRQIKGETK
ncbi:MAG: SBBP repeat-containing protein, partial [Candidatus Aminicenantes bacterium]